MITETEAIWLHRLREPKNLRSLRIRAASRIFAAVIRNILQTRKSVVVRRKVPSIRPLTMRTGIQTFVCTLRIRWSLRVLSDPNRHSVSFTPTSNRAKPREAL